jgi:uncharacterized protein YjiS (DUF1127 family)
MEGINKHAGFVVAETLVELVSAAVSGIWNVLVRIAEAHRKEMMRRELEQLSDRMLKDIGLSRGQINGLFR